MTRKILLSCGILSSIFYMGINIFVPMLFEGYSLNSQTVSELSAIGAPTRPLWVILALIYILMMLIMAFGAAALKKRFRIYTIVTFIVFISFGALIGMQASRIPENLPTPMIGIWERINIGAFMLWVIVFAIVLIRRNKSFKISKASIHGSEKMLQIQKNGLSS